jgi:hypothetical protein
VQAQLPERLPAFEALDRLAITEMRPPTSPAARAFGAGFDVVFAVEKLGRNAKGVRHLVWGNPCPTGDPYSDDYEKKFSINSSTVRSTGPTRIMCPASGPTPRRWDWRRTRRTLNPATLSSSAGRAMGHWTTSESWNPSTAMAQGSVKLQYVPMIGTDPKGECPIAGNPRGHTRTGGRDGVDLYGGEPVLLEFAVERRPCQAE